MAEYEVDYARLCRAVNANYEALKPYREEQLAIAKRVAGDQYHKQTTEKKTYVNLISLYYNIVGRNLIAKNPRGCLTAQEPKDDIITTTMQTFLNENVERMDLAGVLASGVEDSFAGMGICKIGIASPADAARMPGVLKVGEPFAMLIHNEDFVYSVRSHDFNQLQLIGHRYMACMRIVKADDRMSKRARQNLAVATRQRTNYTGEEKIDNIGAPLYRNDEEYLEDMVVLWEITCPQFGKIFTFSDDDICGVSGMNEGGEMVPLLIQDYIGPPTGNYKILRHMRVSGNLPPKGPIQDLMNLDEAANNVYRKLVRQAHDMKKVLLYQETGTEDAENIQKTPDGGFSKVRDPKNFQQVSMNGPDPGLALFLQQLIHHFYEFAGNLATVGGLATQAGTATQEKMLDSNANGQIAAMQDSTTKWVSEIMQALLWYWWHHPQMKMTVKTHLEGSPEMWWNRTLHPWNAEGPPDMMRRNGEMPVLRVDPYSMRHQTPEQRADRMLEFVTKVFMPFAQLAQAQGVTIDLKETLRLYGDLRDMPELKRILTIAQPQEQDGAQKPGAPGTPAETTRKYVREDAGRPSQRAGNANQQAMLQTLQNAQTNGQVNGQPH